MEGKKGNASAHQVLGKLLQELLTSVGIKVVTEFEVMAFPPKGDILILRREQPRWTPEQYAFLPDGLRDSQASDILLEFKYTESVNKAALCQALGYDTFYRRSQQLTETEVQTFILSARTPQPETLQEFEYKPAEKSGVYHSDNIMLKTLLLLALNELRDEPHNAFVKTFASRYLARKAALETLKTMGLQTFPPTVRAVMNFLWRQWTMIKEEMELEITPEQFIELGKQWQEMMLMQMPLEERLAGLGPEEVLTYFKPEERLAGLPVEEIEAYLRKLKSGGQDR